MKMENKNLMEEQNKLKKVLGNMYTQITELKAKQL